MEKTTEKTAATDTSGDDFVRMYPSNQLREPVRSFDDTFSAVVVVQEMFSLKK
jgi:hypothetical protein